MNNDIFYEVTVPELQAPFDVTQVKFLYFLRGSNKIVFFSLLELLFEV